MHAAPAPSPRKRAVNLTLSEAVVRDARALSDNLSSTVESLLADYIAREQEARAERRRAAAAACHEWNAVLDAMGGSFADEHRPF